MKSIFINVLIFVVLLNSSGVFAADKYNLSHKKYICTYLKLEEKKIWDEFDEKMLELREQFIQYAEYKEKGHKCKTVNNIEIIKLLADESFDDWERKHWRLESKYEKEGVTCKDLIMTRVKDTNQISLKWLKDYYYPAYRAIHLYQLIKNY